MRLLRLHGGGVAAVDDEDFEAVSQHRWRLHQTSHPETRTSRYAVTRIASRRVYLHLWLWAHWGRARVPIVDHRNTDGLDCTRDNLRDATVDQNNRNRGKLRTNKSGFKGVRWVEPLAKWRAEISVNSRRTHIGYFSDKHEAARAYDAAAREHHGEFASLNGA